MRLWRKMKMHESVLREKNWLVWVSGWTKAAHLLQQPLVPRQLLSLPHVVALLPQLPPELPQDVLHVQPGGQEVEREQPRGGQAGPLGNEASAYNLLYYLYD